MYKPEYSRAYQERTHLKSAGSSVAHKSHARECTPLVKKTTGSSSAMPQVVATAAAAGLSSNIIGLPPTRRVSSLAGNPSAFHSARAQSSEARAQSTSHGCMKALGDCCSCLCQVLSAVR